jgi:hypothetical protein
MKRLILFLLCFFSLLAFAQNNARMLSGVNSQTGTSYTFVALDATRLTTFANASAVAVTLPNPATQGFGAGNEFDSQNLGAGTATISCSSCLIYSANSTGSATLAITTGSGVELFSSGTNYYALTTSMGGGSTQGPFPLQNCVADQTGATFVNTTSLTNFFYSHYEFMYNPASLSGVNFPIWFNCTIKLPHVLPSGIARIVLDSLSANDATAGHTMAFASCDAIVLASVNVSSLTCAPPSNFSTTATAYAPAILGFAVQSTLTADAMLVVQIKATAESGLATNVLVNGFYLEWQ